MSFTFLESTDEYMSDKIKCALRFSAQPGNQVPLYNGRYSLVASEVSELSDEFSTSDGDEFSTSDGLDDAGLFEILKS